MLSTLQSPHELRLGLLPKDKLRQRNEVEGGMRFELCF